MSQRRIQKQIIKDLAKKMVLVAGPRQVGKTTLAQELLAKDKVAYYNWDDDQHKNLIRKSELDQDAQLWIFDEIHKYRSWRNWLKGKYDLYHHKHQILVTGSAMLDVYSRGGDSMQGRYYFHRLHPFTLAELQNASTEPSLEEINQMSGKSSNDQAVLEQLMDFGGFPEPLFSGSMTEAKRWRNAYGHRLIREDIRDLEEIQMIDKITNLYDHLPYTVGSVLSINSLREDLEVNFKTAARWVDILEKNYACFRIAPFGPAKLRAAKKEKKLYFWDWAKVEKTSARFENLVAMHLLRMCHWFYDTQGIEMDLRFYRDSQRREVDFIILKDKKPWMAIEVKESDHSLDSSLKYFLERVKVPYAYQISLEGKVHKRLADINGAEIWLMPGAKFLANLL